MPVKIRFILLLLIPVLGFFFGKVIADHPQKKVESKTQKIEKKKVPEVTDQFRTIVASAKEKIEEVGGDVLGVSTKYVTELAGDQKEKVEDFIFQNTVGSLLKQIEKLPDKQKDEIKKNICK